MAKSRNQVVADPNAQNREVVSTEETIQKAIDESANSTQGDLVARARQKLDKDIFL